MYKKLITFTVVIGFMFMVTSVGAMPVHLNNVTVTPSHGGVVVSVPAQATANSPVVFLGTTEDPETGEVLEGYAIVHFKRGYHHRPDHAGGPGGNGGGDDTSSCYAVLSKGAKWKNLENYIVDPSNIDGLDEATVRARMADAVTTWNDASGSDIFGSEDLQGVVDASTVGQSVNGQNEVLFADISSSGAIAVTYAWGYFSGRPSAREIIEWDMVFDDVDFEWSFEGDVDNKMDFLNIAVHEAGHAAGLGHPTDTCTEESMFRFATEGEIKKRDLEAGDIAGINELY